MLSEQHLETFRQPADISLFPFPSPLLFISNVSSLFPTLPQHPRQESSDSDWQVRFLPESIFPVIRTCAHTQFAVSSCFLQHQPWERTSAARRQGVGVDQAHMRGLGLSQNLSSLNTALPHPPSLPTPHHSCGEPHRKLQAAIY